MSRTIRRKTGSKGKSASVWNCDPEAEFNRMVEAIKSEQDTPGGRYKYVIKYYIRWTKGCTVYKDYVHRTKVEFHMDRRRGYYSPPTSWVNTYCNRPLRRKAKQQMHYALVNDTWDNTIIEPLISNAGWYFW